MNKKNRKDVFYAIDFVVNLIVIGGIMVYYRNLYLAVGPEKFMYEAILGDLGGNCIFMVVVAISVVCAVIELIYGVRKIRGSVSNITGMMLQWPIMWAIFKGLILIVWIVTSLLGFNLWY